MKGDIQRIFQDYGNEYIEQNAQRLTGQHLKVIHCIQNCRTPGAGWIQMQCPDCHSEHYVERSCGNRMCPTCQTAKTTEWLDKELKHQLPTHYFLITFTVPKQLNRLFLHKPKEAYSALFSATAGALKKLAGNPKYLGVDLPGFFGVLHTWGRTLNFHPHIHFVVPGGGIDKDRDLWRSTDETFYAPGQALAKVCKGIFSELMKKSNLHQDIDESVWYRKWVVDCEAIGENREGAIKYLATYVFKTGITDNRIVAVNNGKVTFTYYRSGSRRRRRMTLDVNEFIRRYLMHVLPNGFMRVRRYGFMGSGCKIRHQRLIALVRLEQGFEVDAIEHVPTKRTPLLCPECGKQLVACQIIKGKPSQIYKLRAIEVQLE